MANHTGRYTTTHDALQRKQTVVTPVGKTITYSYDALSRKSRMQVLDAGVFTYAYDANNQLVVLQNPQHDRTSFSYDNAGRRILKELANGTRATMIYDAVGNMTRIANLKSNDDVISQFNYTYDPVGNKIEIATASGSRTTYSYDATYRLTEEWRTSDSLGWSGMSANDWGNLSADGWGNLQVTSAPAYRNTYAYDPTGNRILNIKDGARTTSTFDAANQNVYSLDGNGRTTYTFDASGNRIGVEKPDGSRTTTTYDYENRDILVQLLTGLRNTMAYDPDGLRVLLEDSSGITKFVYDNQQYLLQTDGSNIITAVQAQEPGTYSNLVSQYQFDGSLWLPNYYHYDNLGNTAELTDSTENVTDTYNYNAWGELLAQAGTTVNPFQYRGRWGYFTNPDTGEVYVLMRTYDPTVGRWTTLDILRFVDGLNMYLAYFVPNGVDPSGGQNEVKTYNWEWAWRHLGSPGSLSFFEKGCVGVTSCMIGKNLWQEGFKSCYPTYKQAESKQVNLVRENPKCCPQIYAFTWLEYVDRWKDGKAPWEIGDDESIIIYPRSEYLPPVHSLFDYQYFDSSEDGWWGATSSKGSGGKVVFIPSDMIDEYNPGQNPLDPPKNAKRNKFRVYCTTCKGNEKLK